jgi:hypothetical protein
MPYLVSKSWWPSDKTTAVINKAFELFPKYPPDPSLSEPVVPNCVRATDKGIENITIAEVKKGKLEDAITAAQKYSVEFHDIVGFEYSVEVWATQIEAFSAIGRKPPE